jgi:hypothetical protein
MGAGFGEKWLCFWVNGKREWVFVGFGEILVNFYLFLTRGFHRNVCLNCDS